MRPFPQDRAPSLSSAVLPLHKARPVRRYRSQCVRDGGPAQVRRHLREPAVEVMHRTVPLCAVHEVLRMVEPFLLPLDR